jgi:hypothetical protein
MLYRSLALLSLVLITAGCALPRAAKVPMDSILIERPAFSGDSTIQPAKRAKVLIVFMPGAMEVPQDLVREGFVEQVRQRNIDADVQIIDSHIGYFMKRTFDVRIREDIVLPAKARGYEQIWFAGISLGGFGSLMYSYIYPGEVTGIISMAPYIAGRSKWREVLEAGGLAQWQPKQPLEKGDYERYLMQWLKSYAGKYGDQRTAEGQQLPELFIGFGSEDGMPEFDKLIKGTLPESRLLRAPGGHDWPPWKQMWGDVLDRAPLPKVK